MQSKVNCVSLAAQRGRGHAVNVEGEREGWRGDGEHFVKNVPAEGREDSDGNFCAACPPA